MRIIALPTIGVALTACAGLEESSTAYLASPEISSGTEVHYTSAAAPVEPDAVVDANLSLEEAVVCRREAVTGSRIKRERCHVPPNEAEAALQEEITRAQLNALREEAHWEQRREMERWGLGPAPATVPGEPEPAGP